MMRVIKSIFVVPLFAFGLAGAAFADDFVPNSEQKECVRTINGFVKDKISIDMPDGTMFLYMQSIVDSIEWKAENRAKEHERRIRSSENIKRVLEDHVEMRRKLEEEEAEELLTKQTTHSDPRGVARARLANNLAIAMTYLCYGYGDNLLTDFQDFNPQAFD